MSGKVALVFGREDSGLPNFAIDRCDKVITIPTTPDYSSLNHSGSITDLWEVFSAFNHDTDSS